MISYFRSIAAGFLLSGFFLLPASSAFAVGRIVLTPERLVQLQQVNDYVNATIIQVSDLEHYGRENVWKVPSDGKGDCKGISLLKRKMLGQRGFPASALSIWVGSTRQGEAHAVLVVTTDQGDYVLDNLTSAILPLSQTGLTIHSRQSGKEWVSATTGERTDNPQVDFVIGPAKQRTGNRG